MGLMARYLEDTSNSAIFSVYSSMKNLDTKMDKRDRSSNPDQILEIELTLYLLLKKI